MISKKHKLDLGVVPERPGQVTIDEVKTQMVDMQENGESL